MTAAVIVIGIALLVYFAVLIGTAMDTERQRVERRHTAAERRALAEERRRLEAERQRVDQERRRLDLLRRRLADEQGGACPLPECPHRHRAEGA